jgi:hypothetical protein
MASTISAGTTSGTAIAIAGDTTGALALQTNNGTTVVTVTTGQLVGVGTTSPSAKLHVSQVGNPIAQFTRSDSGTGLIIASDSSGPYFRPETSSAIRFNNSANSAEYMRLTSAGYLLVGNSANLSSGKIQTYSDNGSFSQQVYQDYSSGTGYFIEFLRTTGTFGSIAGVVGTITASTTNVSYNTSSDYRLKEDIAPMAGALAKVSVLKPCTYKWKIDGSAGQGFIAHELAEVVPDAVSGVKDAVETYTDKDGNEQTRIKPQGIDTSYLVATLTAAIQELNAKVDAQALEIQALKGVA